MNLFRFSLKIRSLVRQCRKNGIDPRTVKVVIYHSLGESVGNVDNVTMDLNIPDDEIPYDIHQIDPVQAGDNVVFINGGN